MKAIPTSPRLARLLVLLVTLLVVAACIEPSRRSGIADSLNRVSFEPPPPTAPTDLTPSGAVSGEEGANGNGGSSLTQAEIFGGSGRRAVTGGAGQARASRGADDGVTLNFDRADIREAVRVILGDVLGRSYTIDPQVSGEVTLSSTGAIAEEDLLTVLESMLRSNDATLVEVAPGTYQILPLENAPPQAEVAPLGGRAPTLRPGYGLTVVPLRNISASAAAQFIQPLVSTPEDIRIDGARNLLLFAGTQGERQSVINILSDLDVNWLADKSVGIFPLRVTTAEAVIPELQGIFGSLDPTVAETPLIRFVPIARLNAVLAIGTNPSQIEEVERWVARLDRGKTVGTQFYVYNLKYAAAEDVAKLLNEIYSEGPGAGLGGGDGLGPAPTGPAGLSPFGQQQQQQQQLGSEDGDFGDGETGDSLLPPAAAPDQSTGTGATPRGVKIVPNRANNSLVIRATPQIYEQIEATLARIDTAPLQVLIEASIVEVLLNDSLRYGVQYFIETNGVRFGFNSGTLPSRGNDGIEPFPQIPGFNFIFSGAGSSNITIDALSSLTDVKVLSSPSVVVQDNREATLTVGSEVPITTRQAQSVVDPDAPFLNSIEYRNTGVILQVRPRINVNGVVNLEIAQEVSRVDQAASGQGDATSLTPTFTQRKITSRIGVQSGQTVVLGGLIEDAESRGRDRIPVLGEIPVVGSLFGTTNSANRRTELIVFITPRVIRSGEDHRDVSEEVRARLRSLRPYAPETALPPVPEPLPAPVVPPVAPPPGPRPVMPPGTLGAAPAAAVPPEEAASALSQGVPEEWLPELVGTGPPVRTPPPPAAEEPVPVPAAPEEAPDVEADASTPPAAVTMAGFDLARAPVPRLRPFNHMPDPPQPRPAVADAGD